MIQKYKLYNNNSNSLNLLHNNCNKKITKNCLNLLKKMIKFIILDYNNNKVNSIIKLNKKIVRVLIFLNIKIQN